MQPHHDEVETRKFYECEKPNLCMNKYAMMQDIIYPGKLTE